MGAGGGEGGGGGVPGPRPLPKKRTIGAGVETVATDFSEFLEETTGTDVLDEGGGVREQVVSGEVGALSHVPAQTQATGLDPVVGNTLEGASVLGRSLSAGGRWGTSLAGVVFDGGGEVGEEPSSVLSAF